MEHFPIRTIIVQYHISLASWRIFFCHIVFQDKTWNSHHSERAVHCAIMPTSRSLTPPSTKHNTVPSSEASLANKYWQICLWQNVEPNIVGFRGNHGLLGLQSGEDVAGSSFPHAGRCSELEYHIWGIFSFSSSLDVFRRERCTAGQVGWWSPWKSLGLTSSWDTGFKIGVLSFF